MIKKLRRKIIAVTMALLTLLLVAILGLVCYFTAQNIENNAISALHSAVKDDFRPGRPGAQRPEGNYPTFFLEKNVWGNLQSGGSGYDLTDQALLEQIYRAAEAEKKNAGILETYGLRYIRVETPGGVRFVFTDAFFQQRSMEHLALSCAVIAAVCMVCFFILSVLLARWVVRPVEEAFSQQNQFVADASHELKTPLTVILTNAELLHSGQYDSQNESRFTQSILSTARQMRFLVEGLLDLTRMENGMAREQEVLDFSQLLEETVLPFEPVFFEQGMTLQSQIQPGICLRGNPLQLRQVVEILLDNARKYSAPGSQVTVSLRKEGRYGKLTVDSPGEPLTQTQCKDIFKRFYRVDTARTGEGYGLGLSIAQSILREHRGKIWAQPTEQGNRFAVQIPL